MARLLIAGALAGLLATAPLLADARSDAFLKTLNDALDANDRQTVATLVEFPLTVISSGFNIPVKDRAALASLYDGVFTPSIRCAIAQSLPPASGGAAKRPPVLTGEALSFGGGTISARLVNGSFKISRLTVVSNGVKAGPGSTQRVAFRSGAGARAAQLAGRLTGGPDIYIATLKRGEILDARIEGFAGRSAIVRAVAPSQAAVRPPVPDNANRVVHVVAAEAGDHQVEVIRLASPCDPDVTYRLNINVR